MGLSPHSLMRQHCVGHVPDPDLSISFSVRFQTLSTNRFHFSIDIASDRNDVTSQSYSLSRSIIIIGRYYVIFYWMALFRCVDLSFVKKRKENLIREKNKVPVEGCFPNILTTRFLFLLANGSAALLKSQPASGREFLWKSKHRPWPMRSPAL